MTAQKPQNQKKEPREWEPKTSDCYLVTGGQLTRLRDAHTREERSKIISEMWSQKYRSDACTQK